MYPLWGSVRTLCVTNVYGEAQTRQRQHTRDMLKNISDDSTLPWLCLGDFNEVLHADGHEGVG
jgi:hypothetical protein